MRVVFIFALIVVAGCAGSGAVGPQAVPVAARAATSRNGAPAVNVTPGHLYVVDLFGNTVYRFRLNNGIPSGTPQNAITGLSGPNSVVVGPDGDLYVSDRQGVKVFAPGASGNALPLRIVPATYVARLAVDASGYLYAGAWGAPPLIAVYAPGAGGVDQPIQTIVAPGQESRVPDLGIALDAQGDLYASVDSGPSTAPSIVVYANPTSNPVVIRQPCAAQRFAYFESLAIGPGAHLYASRGNSVSVFKDTVDACPARPHESFSGSQPSISAIRGIAVSATHLYVGDFLNRTLNTGTVFVFDVSGNPHRPVALLYGTGAGFTTIDDVALGP